MRGGYMGVFVERDPEPAPRRRAERECADCGHYMSGDGGPCNACARQWNDTGYVARPLWEAAEEE